MTIEESKLKMIEVDFKDSVEDEIADILICALAFANYANINLENAILKKMEKNRIKYPVA